jgi:hypothetical protein
MRDKARPILSTQRGVMRDREAFLAPEGRYSSGVGLATLLALLLAPTAAIAQGATICRTFTKDSGLTDTFVRQARPDQSFGTSDALRVNANASDLALALVRVDLSTLTPGAAVQTAQLTLHVRHGSPTSVHAYASPVLWSSYRTTWNNFEPTADPPSPFGVLDHDTQTFDVTQLASDWINLVRPNLGVILAGGDASYDSTRSARPPHLTLC